MEFKPSPKLMPIYFLYYIPYIIVMLVPLVLGIVFDIPPLIIVFGILITIPTIIVAIWIPKFYRSAVFRLENDHAYARYGVWWRKEKRVPYNLVLEVRVRQGPLQRALGLVNVDVFTPATGALRPEITYFQLDAGKANEIASELRRRVGILTARERRVIEEEILDELKSIRALLEKIAERISR